LGRWQQGFAGFAVKLLQSISQIIEVASCFSGPVTVRIDSQIMLPILHSLGIEKQLLKSNGTVEKRYRVIGAASENLAKEIRGLTVVRGPVENLCTEEISGRQVSEH